MDRRPLRLVDACNVGRDDLCATPLELECPEPVERAYIERSQPPELTGEQLRGDAPEVDVSRRQDSRSQLERVVPVRVGGHRATRGIRARGRGAHCASK